MATHTFYDVRGTYRIGPASTNIEGMIGVNCGEVMGIVEDGRLPLSEITLIGGFVEKDGVPQLACIIPSSRGEVYGAIAERKDGGAKDLGGKYEGILFLMGNENVPRSSFSVVGKIGLDLKLSPAELDN